MNQQEQESLESQALTFIKLVTDFAGASRKQTSQDILKARKDISCF